MTIEELKELQNKVIIKNKKIKYMFWAIWGFLVLSIIVFNIYIKNTMGSIFDFNFFNIFFMNDLFMNMVFVSFFVFVSFIITRHMILKGDIEEFNKNFKRIFVYNSLKETFDNLTYVQKDGLKASDIEDVGLIYLGDRFSSNDYISGTYKDIKFEQSDLHIEERVEEVGKDGEKSEDWTTTFLGRWMSFDFNKNFRANVIVANSWNFKWKSSYKKIKMEDDDFNKKFSVYTENEHDAYYILTPHFMEKIKNIGNSINGHICFGFINNRLYVAINNYKDSFECDIYKPIDEEEVKRNILKDIKVITDFVDELNLDNNLFKEK